MKWVEHITTVKQDGNIWDFLVWKKKWGDVIEVYNTTYYIQLAAGIAKWSLCIQNTVAGGGSSIRISLYGSIWWATVI